MIKIHQFTISVNSKIRQFIIFRIENLAIYYFQVFENLTIHYFREIDIFGILKNRQNYVIPKIIVIN